MCRPLSGDEGFYYHGAKPENGSQAEAEKPKPVVPTVVENLPEDGCIDCGRAIKGNFARCFDCHIKAKEAGIVTKPALKAPKATATATPTATTTATAATGDPLRDAIAGIAKDVYSKLTEDVKVEFSDIRAGIDSMLPDMVRAKVDQVLDDDRLLKLIQTAGVQRHEILFGDKKVELPATTHEKVPSIIRVLTTGANLFLVGPAGSGKSTAAMQAADAMGLKFYSMSFGPTTPTSKLFGYMNATGDYVRVPFREAYEHGGLFLGDEIDNGHPGLVAELNQAIANGYAAFADGMVAKHDDFRFVATGNTFGKGPDRLFVGRNILDAATLDRFVTMEFPIDEGLERRLAVAWATDENDVAKWIDYVQLVRRRVVELNLPVVVSPRATIDGAKLLAAGMEWDEVKECRLFAGIKDDVRVKIGG